MLDQLFVFLACVVAFLFFGGDFILIGLYWLWRVCRPTE